jgi:DNA processing protein
MKITAPKNPDNTAPNTLSIPPPVYPDDAESLLWHKLSMYYEPGDNRLWEIYREKGLDGFSKLRELLPADEAQTAIFDKCKSLGFGVLTYASPFYPAALRELYNPPAVIYYKGDVSVFAASPTIAIVGARNSSKYAVAVTEKLVKALMRFDPGYVFISGFAVGTDITVHLTAIKHGGKTIAVKGCGIDYPYPDKNMIHLDEIAADGLIISEYPPGTKPLPTRFPLRNRIIAGLSGGVIVTEGSAKSGALSTAHLAADYGKDVFAIPPRDITDPACQGNIMLLREGAIPVYGTRDILTQSPKFVSDLLRAAQNEISDKSQSSAAGPPIVEEFTPIPPADIFEPDMRLLDAVGLTIFDLVKASPGKLSAEDLSARIDLSPQAVFDTICDLEMGEYIRRNADGMFE